MLLAAGLTIALLADASPLPSPSPSGSVPAAATAPPLPPCATVDAKLLDTVDSKVVHAGQRFSFATTAAVTFGGKELPAGTQGAGIVQSFDQSKSHGHSGYLILDARYLERADGSHVPVSFVPGGDGRSPAYQRGGSSNSPAGVGYIPFVGNGASVYDYFHHGKDAALVAGTTFPLALGDGFIEGTCALAPR